MGAKLRLFKDAATIQARVRDLGLAVAATHRDRNPIVIGLLNGGFVFLADLVRAMDMPCEVEFWRVASYGSGTTSSGEVEEPWPPLVNVAGRHVVVVEDIVTSGRTIRYIRAELARRQAASVTIVALLKTMSCTEPLDYIGFVCGPHFLVGYGLDLDGQLRNLPDLHYLVA